MGKIDIRPYKDSLGIFIDDKMMIFGLTKCEASAWYRDYMKFDVKNIIDVADDPYPRTRITSILPTVKRPGRPLILEAYVDILRALVAERPNSTIKEIETKLREKGAEFSNKFAVINLAKRYKINIRDPLIDEEALLSGRYLYKSIC